MISSHSFHWFTHNFNANDSVTPVTVWFSPNRVRRFRSRFYKKQIFFSLLICGVHKYPLTCKKIQEIFKEPCQPVNGQKWVRNYEKWVHTCMRPFSNYSNGGNSIPAKIPVRKVATTNRDWPGAKRKLANCPKWSWSTWRNHKRICRWRKRKKEECIRIDGVNSPKAEELRWL